VSRALGRSAARACDDAQVEMFGLGRVAVRAPLASFDAPLAKTVPPVTPGARAAHAGGALPVAAPRTAVDLCVHRASTADLHALVGLQPRVRESARRDEANLRALLLRGVCLIAETGHSVAGLGAAHVLDTRTEGSVWHVAALQLDPTVEGQGIDLRLLGALVKAARRPLVTASASSGASAEALRAFGFRERGAFFVWEGHALPYRPAWSYPSPLFHDPRRPA
jgi:GNAT superfamily N-acetyltransferase